jgi:hypothetical protein
MMTRLGLAAVFAVTAWISIHAAPALATNIYKVVDEDGNVTFTDRQPAPGAKPLKLRELSVIPRPEYAPRPNSVQPSASPAETPSAAVVEQQQGPTLAELRSRFRNFRLVSPAEEQTFTGTANIATIAWDTGAPLLPGMTVRAYVDDQPLAPTTSDVVATERLNRGTHTARADLLSAQGEVVASAGPVTFFMFQASRLFPARRAGG